MRGFLALFLVFVLSAACTNIVVPATSAPTAPGTATPTSAATTTATFKATASPSPSPIASPTAAPIGTPSPTPAASASPPASAAATSTAITSPPAGSPLAQLMATIPDAMRQDCHEVTSFDAGFLVGVSCLPDSVDGYVTYYLFDSVDNLTASYQANADFFGAGADGTSCQTEAAEGEYTINDVPAGRLMCNEYDEGLIAYWSHDALATEASLVLFSGTFADLYAIWQVAGPIVAQGPGATPVPATWTTRATDFRGLVNQLFDFICPAAGTASAVWGTDTYTDDSSVCTAAVHAGLIDLASGGTVTIEMRPGLDEYPASARNGITSLRWGSWNSSFVFVTP